MKVKRDFLFLTYIDDEICEARASVTASPDPIQWRGVIRMK